MRSNFMKSILITSGLAASLLLAGGTALAQSVNLAAGPSTLTMPDGTVVPMWGYTCGTAVTGSLATCAPLNPNAGTGWSPVVITVPYSSTGTSLTVNLTNNLTFATTGAANNIPTSLTIVGQLGGGLGGGGKKVNGPVHPPLGVSWSTANTGAIFNPPPQPPRTQSFATEVAVGSPAVLSWTGLKPGTYLIESGTHPSIQGPMGLYGVLVVTTAPSATSAGVAYGSGTTAVTYDADIPVIFSEIDPVQNMAVNAAVTTAGFNENASRGLILQAGPIASVDVLNGGGGFNPLSPPTVTITGAGGTGATGVAVVNSSGQIASITITNGGSGYTGSVAASGISISNAGGGSGAILQANLGVAANSASACHYVNAVTPDAAACYPSAVNYTPLYYLINGVAFDKTHPTNSLFAATAPVTAPSTLTNTATGLVLVRMVNAGLRMHVPSIVGSLTYNAATSATTPVGGMSLIAEDGNRLPGFARVQSEVFMAAGKTYDVMINGPASATAPAIPIYDRELSLSGNGTARDAGMLAYLGVNHAGLPVTAGTGVFAPAAANNDTYPSLVAGQGLSVTDPGKGVMANDVNVYGVKLLTPPSNGTVVLNTNGTFTYTPTNLTSTSDSFTYCANGSVTGTTCSSGLTATVTLSATTQTETASGIVLGSQTFTSNISTYIAVKTPGLLQGATDSLNLPLTIATGSITGATGGMTVTADANGGFTATAPAAGTYTFQFQAQNSQGLLSAVTTATVVFSTPSNLTVNVVDGATGAAISDYRWVIEEDRTFYINPACLINANAAGCTTTTTGINPTLGVNFHTSYMPFVAQGCTGPLSCEAGQTQLGKPVVCDVGNGFCRPDTTGAGQTPYFPGQVHLDPTKRYYLSVLPGDAYVPFSSGYQGAPDCSAAGMKAGHCGHGMGGAPIPAVCLPGTAATCTTALPTIKVLAQPSPYPPGKLSVLVFEDDFPLNGEQDGGGGVDVLSPNEPGLGGFQIHMWDAMGGNGDFTGQMTYDMFNQPLTNSLDGTLDPATGLNACPITQQAAGITGMIVTCPKYESDGTTLSPLAGQAVIVNLMPGRWGIIATPAADRIARGEEWLQTNTLDGQKAHDSFTRIGEPAYFQEFGPASFHVSIGFANPAIINSRHQYVCNGTDVNITGTNCNTNLGQPGNTLIGKVTGEHLSRTPDERLFDTTTHDAYAWTQCYVSFGDADGEDFAFTKCDADGNWKLTNLPDGDWRITVFDQWNDGLVDGLSTPVRLSGGAAGATTNFGNISTTQWETNLQTRTFIDDNRDGVSQSTEAGISFANVAVRLRDGSLENLLVTDFTGSANFNETFPLFSWYVVETDVTRYKNTGTHAVYDAGGPPDGTLNTCGGSLPGAGYPTCGTSTIGKFLANTSEQVSLPNNLRIPGSVYCTNADCVGFSINPTYTNLKSGVANGTTNVSPSCTYNAGTPTANPPVLPTVTCASALSTGRIDSPLMGGTEGWQGFPGQFSFLEFGKTPYIPGENGGIKGHVVYASTRPFDDPQMLVQTQWTPLVPNVRINLYKEGFEADGVTPTLTLVDFTTTSSWDNWAQGFRTLTDGTVVPNMSCPGQTSADLFFYTLYNQPEYLDLYNNVLHGGATAATPLPYYSQFKCYDGMHNWNQLQPAPYDGMYSFPSVTAIDPTTGKPAGTNCTGCTTNPDANDPFLGGTPMLPIGKYVVEVVLPPGFELVKEEDKNILIGDNFIAPATQQIGGLGNVFIVPDQAQIGSQYNAYNPQNPTQSLGMQPTNYLVPGFTPEPLWPCVGELRVVPDYISLYPKTHQVAPFAGASRHLCDRKEVTLNDQSHSIAKFYVFTSTHIASKFTGGITDDYTSEFDPFSPQFGEKFAPPQLPVAVRDWAGNETNRVYADNWGAYNGMTYSTWEVNPPNPTGYSPTMMVFCMNDPGPIPNPAGGTPITDPLYTQGYSQFCYELPFMPGTTQYLDTPVVPTSAFAGAGYNNVDCSYPALTPAIASVTNVAAEGSLPAGSGPWVSAAATTPGTHSLTITALGDQMVPNNAYSGPNFSAAPFNTKTILRHYGFGSTQGTVTIGGVPAHIDSWVDGTIVVDVPPGVPHCAIQQQAIYGGSTARCGELVVTTAAGAQSVDAVTVTVGGKAPIVLPATAVNQPLTPTGAGAIQQAIDAANPGDMIIVPPGVYNEMILMWKPVRLQGVGAATSIINANTQPAGKLDPWRRQVNCLFGLALNGTPISAGNPYDSSGTYTCPSNQQFQVDRLALEATVGWDATLNGNLAQLLQEPTLMGALEGAAITVLSKGVQFPAGSNPFAADTYPVGTTLLTAGNCLVGGVNPYPSNFQCNPSRIDGLGLTDSSQGGGAVFVHAYGHNLEIANNRIANNAGTLSGGINLGQGEFPPAYIAGGTTNADPNSCAVQHPNGTATFANQNGVNTTIPVNGVMPYCHNLNVNIHNNYVSLNSSTGDELFSSTPAGAGGVSICTGADNYMFNYNWVCGNLSSGDGGGFGHLGFSFNGDIEHNTFIFNQSLNPTIPANGGGLIIMGAPDVDPTCGAVTDQDCVSAPGAIGPSDGVGRNLLINANLIMGNAAEAGTGGGISFQNLNGSDVVALPNTPQYWNNVTVTNNVIANNVAGWDGGGISLLDALNINIVNNTIMSNVSTATAGVLFNTIGAPLASQQGPTCTSNCGTTSLPQVAGLVAVQNSAVLGANLPASITCPAGHYFGPAAVNGTCRTTSYPELYNNVIWQNTAYYIGVGALSAQFQQNVISLYNAFTKTAVSNQPITPATTANGGGVIVTGGSGACTLPGTANAPSFWDIGVRGDTGPASHDSGVVLSPQYTILTDATDYPGLNNTNGNPTVVSQYCNGSRQPPEACAGVAGGCGWNVPPGISDATVPNPIFNLTPVATVDEGNNWINLRWGPLTLANPISGARLGNFAPTIGSSVINYVPVGTPAYTVAPALDFFGNNRKGGNALDAGAIAFARTAGTTRDADISGGPLGFGNVPQTTNSASQTLTLHNTGNATLTYTVTVTAPFVRTGGTCNGTLSVATADCTINVALDTTAATPLGAVNGTLTVTGTGASAGVVVTGSPVALSGTVVAAVRTATVTGGPLAFGNWAVGFNSVRQVLTVTNTGNVTLTGGATAISGPGAAAYFVSGGTCGTTLAVNASCTVFVTFHPSAVTTYTASLTGSATGATVTGIPVALTGSGVANRAPVAIQPVTPINLPAGAFTGTATVTFTNTAAAGGSQVAVTNVAANGLGFVWFYSAPASGNNCLNVAIPPGGSCTAQVQITRFFGTGTLNGTVSFTDTGLASPQSAPVQTIAN